MATGRGIQLTKQIGEYLVAAELGRNGFLAATFSGNVPDYDIIATDPAFGSVPIQVKAIRSGSWQLDFRQFAEVVLVGKRQSVSKVLHRARPLVYVMVALGEYGGDRFYVLEWRQLRDILARSYRAYLKKHGGVRPKRHDSTHVSIEEEQLAKFRDNWQMIGVLCR